MMILPVAMILAFTLFAQNQALSNTQYDIDGYEPFEQNANSTYKLYPYHRSWYEAVTICKRDGEGSRLMVVNNRQETEVVQEMFKRLALGVGFMHTGINDIVQEGTWVTNEGVLLYSSGFNAWAKGEPNGHEGPGEDCGVIDRKNLYYDFDCSVLFPFICERPVAEILNF